MDFPRQHGYVVPTLADGGKRGRWHGEFTNVGPMLADGGKRGRWLSVFTNVGPMLGWDVKNGNWSQKLICGK